MSVRCDWAESNCPSIRNALESWIHFGKMRLGHFSGPSQLKDSVPLKSLIFFLISKSWFLRPLDVAENQHPHFLQVYE